jgi:hypothetical protein
MENLSADQSGYNCRYVLTIAQKFAIPENISNGDYVDFWKKTPTWIPSGNISYSIERNYKNAFSINASTGLITVSDATKINGKIVLKDTLINIIIRTNDSGIGSELDTAQIWVKENAYCKFFDYGYSGSESGTKSQPYNDLDDVTITPGFGYFLKRGNVFFEQTTLEGFRSLAGNPTLFGAYGTGENPTFDGGNANAVCFFLGDLGGDNMVNNRSEHIYFYSLTIRDFGSSAFQVPRNSGYMGWYNCKFFNNDWGKHESTIALNTQEDYDNFIYRPFEVIDCDLDTTFTGFIKCNVGPLRVMNCTVNHAGDGASNGSGIRLCNGRNSILTHNLLQNINYKAIQLRGDSNTVEDCRIVNSGWDGIVCEVCTLPNGPDHIRIKNCYIENTGNRAITIWKSNAGFNIMHDYIIEDCFLKKGSAGIVINQGNDITIRKNIICEFGKNGGLRLNDQYGTNEVNNINISYNILFDNTNDLMGMNGSDFRYYNNTSDGIVDFTGSSKAIVKNNILKTLINSAVSSNNLVINSINPSAYFRDFANHDYRLKSTAENVIDKGSEVGLKDDFEGKRLIGLPDIGALEYDENTVRLKNNPKPMNLDYDALGIQLNYAFYANKQTLFLCIGNGFNFH